MQKGTSVLAGDPWQLMTKGRFKEAAEAYTPKADTGDLPSLANRALAFLNLGDVDRALADAIRWEQEHPRQRLDPADGGLCTIGMLYWLKGNGSTALAAWDEAVTGLLFGRITFSDASGGVGAAALLWFGAGPSADRAPLRNKALTLIKKRLKTKRGNDWPGPVGMYLIGNMSGALLRSVAQAGEHEKIAARQLCVADFYLGVKALEESDAERGEQLLAESVALGAKSLIEEEYYLARYELTRRHAATSSS